MKIANIIETSYTRCYSVYLFHISVYIVLRPSRSYTLRCGRETVWIQLCWGEKELGRWEVCNVL